VGRKCVGFVEAVGLAAALQAADTIAKSANVRLLGYEYSGYDGHILIKFEAVYDVLVHNKNTVGDSLQIASGKRPQGTNRQAKWVGHWEQKGCYIRE